MSRINFVPLPPALVAEKQIDLTTDFGFVPVSASAAGDDTVVVFSSLFYNYYRYNPSDNRFFGTFFATRYDRDLNLIEQVEIRAVHNAIKSDDTFDYAEKFAVLESGELIICTRSGRTFVCDSKGALRREWSLYDWSDRARMYRESFAASVAPGPDNRLLCVVAEADLQFFGNIIARSREPVASLVRADTTPTLDYITSLSAMSGAGYPIPFVRLPGDEPFTDKIRPAPALADAVYAAGLVAPARFLGSSLPAMRFFRPRITQATPLSDDRFFIGIVEGSRPDKNSSFCFCLVDRAGVPQAALPLADGDTPFKDGHYAVACGPAARRLRYKTATTFYEFNESGKQTLCLPLDATANLKAFRHFRLLGPGRGDGSGLLLAHPKEGLLLALDAPDDSADWAGVIEDGVANYKQWRTAQKKARNPVNYRWLGE